MKRLGIVYRNKAANENCTHMWAVVTRNGEGKPKRSGENIHLLYKDRSMAKKNL